jgi:hypothetical protein
MPHRHFCANEDRDGTILGESAWSDTGCSRFLHRRGFPKGFCEQVRYSNRFATRISLDFESSSFNLYLDHRYAVSASLRSTTASVREVDDLLREIFSANWVRVIRRGTSK